MCSKVTQRQTIVLSPAITGTKSLGAVAFSTRGKFSRKEKHITNFSPRKASAMVLFLLISKRLCCRIYVTSANTASDDITIPINLEDNRLLRREIKIQIRVANIRKENYSCTRENFQLKLWDFTINGGHIDIIYKLRAISLVLEILFGPIQDSLFRALC